VAFTYDADGARIKKVVGTGGSAKTTTYLNDKRALAQVLQETGPNANNVVRTMSYVPGLLQHDSSSTTWLYPHADALSNRVLTDGSQAVANRWSYDPFGAIRGPDSDDGKSDFGFAGEQKDQETGLINLRARYYDPSLGRFLQRDPVPAAGTFPQALNRYSYGINNPIRVLDPTGLTCGSYYDTEGCDDDGSNIGVDDSSGCSGCSDPPESASDNPGPSVSADSSSPEATAGSLVACAALNTEPTCGSMQLRTSSDRLADESMEGCVATLQCDLDDFVEASWEARLQWLSLLQERYGLKGWFNNIKGILRYLSESFVLAKSKFMKAADGGVLFVIQEGLASSLNRSETSLTAGKLWHKFFQLLNSDDEQVADHQLREAWGQAEQSGVNYGLSVARDGHKVKMLPVESLLVENLTHLTNQYRGAVTSNTNPIHFLWPHQPDPRHDEELVYERAHWVQNFTLLEFGINGD
jgi:RHS repeat-associated protein